MAEQEKCPSCQISPCLTTRFTFQEEEGLKLRTNFREKHAKKLHKDDNSGFRVAYYWWCNTVILGKTERSPTPECLVKVLKESIYGDQRGNYVGYKATSDSPSSSTVEMTACEGNIAVFTECALNTTPSKENVVDCDSVQTSSGSPSSDASLSEKAPTPHIHKKQRI